jgi:diaminohydroxyphosphoribosylaminopyrimidine deaminase / 5-amino-6-(5-phosphoribosylamino)uracil reductase
MPNPLSSMSNESDIMNMHHALRLAARGLGRVWPNPSVGAVIIKNDRIIGRGITARGGRPHAEPQAIAEAGADARGATLYVTLEPCSHHGQTPPCVDAIIQAGIARVVAACGDVNPQVAGKGFAALRAAGIEVTEGLCAAEARALNEGFFSVVERGRPFVSLKIATSLDGRTATNTGESKWITGETARECGHALRASQDAILTGIGTILADNPALTCRLPGRAADSPQRVVLDSNLRIPLNAKALPAWIFTAEHADAAKIKALQSANCQLWQLPLMNGRIPLDSTLRLLAEKGITRLLVEAGKTLTESFMAANLADRIYWFRSPQVVGDVSSTVAVPRFSAKQVERIGQDSLEIYDLRRM